MYKYIHTCSSPIAGQMRDFIHPYVKNYLYSLINGFTRKQFGFDSIERCARTVKEFSKVLQKDEDLYVDSGGYSIIKGDIPPKQISIFIDTYNYFVENYMDYYDYIFSLDIPAFIKYVSENNVTKILDYNMKSCYYTKQVLDSKVDLYDKFIFVWQFKLPKQYSIWNKVYDSIYRKNSKIKHFALGGMVGLRRDTNIKFSPFIVPIYKILRLVQENSFNDTSILHMLGVYGRHDRFIMQFLDYLFNDYYLKDHPSLVNITYDTTNYTIAGVFRVREFGFLELPGYDKENDVFIENLTPLEKIELLSPNHQIKSFIINEMKQVMLKEPIGNTTDFSMLNIVSNNIIDITFKHFIRDNNLLDMFLNSPNFNRFKNCLSPYLDIAMQKFPSAFQGIKTGILENFRWIYTMHTYWEKGMTEDEIDKCVYRFVKHDSGYAINYPYDLSGCI